MVVVPKLADEQLRHLCSKDRLGSEGGSSGSCPKQSQPFLTFYFVFAFFVCVLV